MWEIFKIRWFIPSTHFTPEITLRLCTFLCCKERDNYLYSHKKSWWEYLPFVKVRYFIDKVTLDELVEFTTTAKYNNIRVSKRERNKK